MTSSQELASFLSRISAGRDGVPISIDEAQEVSGLRRASVLERFRALQSAGEGYLRLGRHGHPTRFYFRSPSTAKPGSGAGIASAAVRQSEAADPPSPSESAAMVEHGYQLRADLRLSIRLPADLTEREAGRVARFIETLPL